MRRKKHKHTRRALRFYRITHGFRPPYKVLLDGNFVHALDAMRCGGRAPGRLHGAAVQCVCAGVCCKGGCMRWTPQGLRL